MTFARSSQPCLAQYFSDLEPEGALLDLALQSKETGWLPEERTEVSPGPPTVYFKRDAERRIIFARPAPKGTIACVMDKTEDGNLVGSP